MAIKNLTADFKLNKRKHESIDTEINYNYQTKFDTQISQQRIKRFDFIASTEDDNAFNSSSNTIKNPICVEGNSDYFPNTSTFDILSLWDIRIKEIFKKTSRIEQESK